MEQGGRPVDNLFIKLLDRRGRVLWVCDNLDRTAWDRPVCEFAYEEDRNLAEENFARCVVHGEAVSFVARWYCPLADTVVWAMTNMHPLEPVVAMSPIAVILVQSVLPGNYEEFTESDRELLRLLAEDMNIKDAAATVDRSESAIDARIRSLKSKLGKHTLHGLVASAIRSKLIPSVPAEYLEIVSRIEANQAATAVDRNA